MIYAEETKKRNKELIMQMNKENKELKTVREDLLNKKKQALKKMKPLSAFSRLENVVYWRNQLNNTKNKVAKKRKLILNLQDKLNELNLMQNFNFEETPHHK